MIFGDDKQAEITLSRITYYKIKEFGRPFCRKIESGIDYQGKSFEDILSRDIIKIKTYVFNFSTL